MVDTRFKDRELHLVVVLDALPTERNLMGAACRINRAQPVMSAAGARLLDYLRDKLATMSAEVFKLNAASGSSCPPVRDALPPIQCSFISSDSLTRLYRIAASGSFFPISSRSYFLPRPTPIGREQN